MNRRYDITKISIQSHILPIVTVGMRDRNVFQYHNPQ
jgi:hypothetical protein